MTPNEKISQVVGKFMEHRRNHPDWREGQSAFNALYDLYPEVANEIRGSDCDPFHRDSNLEDFWDKMAELIGE